MPPAQPRLAGIAILTNTAVSAVVVVLALVSAVAVGAAVLAAGASLMAPPVLAAATLVGPEGTEVHADEVVLYLCGFRGKPDPLLPLARTVENELGVPGWFVVTDSIDHLADDAKQLSEILAAKLLRTPQVLRLYVVGYSTGGLLAHEVLTREPRPSWADRVVLVIAIGASYEALLLPQYRWLGFQLPPFAISFGEWYLGSFSMASDLYFDHDYPPLPEGVAYAAVAGVAEHTRGLSIPAPGDGIVSLKSAFAFLRRYGGLGGVVVAGDHLALPYAPAAVKTMADWIALVHQKYNQ